MAKLWVKKANNKRVRKESRKRRNLKINPKRMEIKTKTIVIVDQVGVDKETKIRMEVDLKKEK